MESAQKLFTKMYEQAGAAAGAGAQAGPTPEAWSGSGMVSRVMML